MGTLIPIPQGESPFGGYLGGSETDGYIERDTARRIPVGGYLGGSVNDGYIEPDYYYRKENPRWRLFRGSVTDVFTEPVTVRRDPVDVYLTFF